MSLKKLMMKLDLEEPEEQSMSKFLGGLDRNVARKLELQPYSTLDELYHLALKVEKDQKEKKKKPAFKSNFPFYKGSTTYTPKPEAARKVEAAKEKDKGKGILSTPDKKSNVKCYKCQGYGHYQADCPNKRVMTLMEIETIEEEMEQDREFSQPIYDDYADAEPEMEQPVAEKPEKVLGPMSGLSLVLRRVLHATDPATPASQREVLFQTKCLVMGRVCKMIIDGGSCTNLASQTMIEKLSHPTFKHPEPYKLHWLNDGSSVEVRKQALVTFHFGPDYEDQILCDVLPMDACHLLLGRPWQSDRRITHDGRENTYSFKINHKKF
jgi:hypothetical protein